MQIRSKMRYNARRPHFVSGQKSVKFFAKGDSLNAKNIKICHLDDSRYGFIIALEWL
jgi:hypothetical protein